MPILYAIRFSNGKLRTSSTSHEHARREVDWLRNSGIDDELIVEPFERNSEWGAPRRFTGPWCSAKNEEFKLRYGRLEPVKELAEYFDCSIDGICKKARAFGFARRIDDPRTFERHHGRWTEREYQLVNFMYDEGIAVRELPRHIPRGQGAIMGALFASASTYSTRSKNGRFIAKGRRTIHRVLEASSEFAPDYEASD